MSNMIDVVVNGTATSSRAPTLAELVSEQGFEPHAVATARNGDFVARARRGETALAPGDRIEIVSARQGG